MQRLGGAVIRMQLDYNRIKFYVGNAEVFRTIHKVKALTIFDEKVVSFFADLSERLMRQKKYPDIVSYAFWIRKNNLIKMREEYLGGARRIGRGLAFHITPSNIPIQFIVSLTYALLAGNASCIRVSSKNFEQVNIICDGINELLKQKYPELTPYICICEYGYEKMYTDYLSSVCDIRIVWGGNQTIEVIKASPVAPRTVEMCFADRFSIAIINAKAFLEGKQEVLIDDFYLDTFYIDQNACSSPRMIIWLGEEVAEAKQTFWELLYAKAKKEYVLNEIASIDKYDKLCQLASQKRVKKVCRMDNLIYRIEVDTLDEDIFDYKEGCGFFFEYEAQKLEEIVQILGKTCQTITVLGVEKEQVEEIIIQYGVRGGDRIVPVGHSLELSLVWDGIDMINNMSRMIK